MRRGSAPRSLPSPAAIDGRREGDPLRAPPNKRRTLCGTRINIALARRSGVMWCGGGSNSVWIAYSCALSGRIPAWECRAKRIGGRCGGPIRARAGRAPGRARGCGASRSARGGVGLASCTRVTTASVGTVQWAGPQVLNSEQIPESTAILTLFGMRCAPLLFYWLRSPGHFLFRIWNTPTLNIDIHQHLCFLSPSNFRCGSARTVEDGG